MTNVMRREVLWARPVLQASPSLRPSERSDQAKGKTHRGQGRGYSSVEPVLLGVQPRAPGPPGPRGADVRVR